MNISTYNATLEVLKDFTFKLIEFSPKVEIINFCNDYVENFEKNKYKYLKKIKNINKGYYKCFVETEEDNCGILIGDLLSECHSMVIKNGIKLDRDIIPNKKFNKNNILFNVNSGNININIESHYSKFRILVSDFNYIYPKKAIEIDYIMIDKFNINIFEIKNGYDFDTKKSESEIASLLKISKYFNQLDNIKNIKLYVVFWNIKNICDNSFKVNILPENCQLITGKKFCELVNCDYDLMNIELYNKNKQNKQWFLRKITEIINNS